MARKLRRLTYEDRLILENMLKQDTPLVKIAEEVGVTRQCIYKELQRNGKIENTMLTRLRNVCLQSADVKKYQYNLKQLFIS